MSTNKPSMEEITTNVPERAWGRCIAYYFSPYWQNLLGGEWVPDIERNWDNYMSWRIKIDKQRNRSR